MKRMIGIRATLASIGILFALGTAAEATVVQTTNRIMNNGRTDFGSGTHAGGGPTGSATITYDWNTASGDLIVTGRVRGTLYWDSLFSGGCARLTIRFRNAAGANLDVRQIDECGPGGNANDTTNKTAVDESFAGETLDRIVLTVSEVQNGTEVNANSITITQVVEKNFPVTIQNGVADFGEGIHAFGFPQEPANIIFRRNGNGTVTGRTRGILYYDSFSRNSCSQLILDRRTPTGGILERDVFLNCGPGGNANEAANQLFVDETNTSGFLSEIRLNVSDTAFPRSAVITTFGFAGSVGDFEVDPAAASARANERLNYSFIWTVPEPRNWHDIEHLDLRVMDGSNPILHLRFYEEGNLFSVLHDVTGKFGKPFPAGSGAQLQSRYAALDLAKTTVGPVNNAIGVGPNSPTVKIDLALRFKLPAGGKDYTVEVAAKDDFGNEDPFALAGTISVER